MDTKIIEALAKTGIIITPTTHLQAKIDIAKEYVALHTEFDVPHKGADSGFEDVYNSLYQCYYGEARLVDDQTGEYEIEIGSHETKSGNPVLFTFIDPDHLENLYPHIIEMKSEGFTTLQILDGLQDGAVLSFYGISQDEAEDMHSYLKNLPDCSIQSENRYLGTSIAEAVAMFTPKNTQGQ